MLVKLPRRHYVHRSKSGRGFLGDLDELEIYESTGLKDTKMKIRMTFAFAVIAVLLGGYADSAPAVAAETGGSGSVSVDAGAAPATAVQNFSEAQISPDGERIAWVEAVTNSQGVPTGASRIVLASVKTPQAVRTITAQAGKACDESSVAWSPDSKQIAFLSDAAHSDQLQLYVAAPGGAARKAAHACERRLSNPHLVA